MKKILKGLASAVVIAGTLLGFAPHSASALETTAIPQANNATVAEAPQQSVKELGSVLLGYFGQAADSDWTLDPTTDMTRVLDKIKAQSPKDFDLYSNLLKKWKYIETEMPLNIGEAPNGLPNDKSLSIMTLGFGLNADGTMKDELVGRLEVTLAAAQKYPNAYVLVTGGVEKNGWTEGIRMRDWLLSKGVDEKRIIVEHQSADTKQNMSFSFDLLHQHPEIKKVLLISSEYHLRRSSILFYAESLLKANEWREEPIELAGNVGWLRDDLRVESMNQKLNSLKGILDVPAPQKLPFSQLKNIDVKLPATVGLGEKLTPKVTAEYDQENFKRDVSRLVTISGYDSTQVGSQTVTVSYRENGIVKTQQSQLTITAPNKDQLALFVNKAEKLSAKAYTTASWSKLQTALARAKKVLADPAATAGKISEATTALDKAIQQLVNAKPDTNQTIINSDKKPGNSNKGNENSQGAKDGEKFPQTGDEVNQALAVAGLVIVITLSSAGLLKLGKES